MPQGNATSTECTIGDSVWVNYFADPHFVANPLFDSLPFPLTTFYDQTEPANQCGDLSFDGRTRSFTAYYATDPDKPQENPWKYWWRRSRQADNGTGVLYALDPIYRVAGEFGTDTVTISLSDEYDAVGVVLVLNQSSELEISHDPFIDDSFDDYGDLNVVVQHWDHRLAPVLKSAVRNGTTISLAWTNKHAGRSMDSTNIYRGGTYLTTVGPTDSLYADVNVPAGAHTYSLKHFSGPAAMTANFVAPFPNSDSSTAIRVATACARLADSPSAANTWQHTDQLVSAGCSELGANKRFRWFRADSTPLTNWTSDTLFDFVGHTYTDSQIVVLRDSNTATHATTEDTLNFTVYGAWVQLQGPTYVTDQQQKVYWADSSGTDSTHAGQWFERYDDGPQWYPATAYDQDTLLRIWPTGEYTVDLRQQRYPAYPAILRRGRLAVYVCNSRDCEGDPAPPMSPDAPASGAAEWGLFGAGPWIGWGGPEGRRVIRLYDLWGMHDRQTAFADARWFVGDGAQVSDAASGWQVGWTPRDLGVPDTRAFDVSVSATRSRDYVFSMAVDPDLGPDAGDDVASYDPQRGMVLVADGERAVGLLLRADRRNALAAVQEYGVGRWAPTVPDTAWAAQRTVGVHLRGTPRDVQFVLSTAETAESSTWLFVVVRGDTPAAVRETADAVLRTLR